MHLSNGFEYLAIVLVIAGFIAAVTAAASDVRQDRINVLNFGAKTDGSTDATDAIQAAIDACHQQGGGEVSFPPGTYLCGSLHLKSHVALYLAHGAKILTSTDDSDFDTYEKLDFPNDADHETTFFHFALIWGEDIENIAILGTGMIDGNRTKRGGPKPIALKRCRQVTIKDISIVNAPNYAISLLGTDYVNIDGVTIRNCFCDGIDPDCCRHVHIANCQIESRDDAIVPKASFSLGYRRSTEYLTVTNCQLATTCNAFKLGTESGGDFKFITVSNCVFYNLEQSDLPSSGIALESVDGAHIDGIAISNISMQNVEAPIFLRLGNRGRDMDVATPGTLKNVIISNITATGAIRACQVAGIPGHPVAGVTLDNIQVCFRGGGARELAQREIPEQIAKYPESSMFGELPVYGLYCRHATGLKARNLQFSLESSDLRHALVFEDVQFLELESLTAPAIEGAVATIDLRQVKHALITKCLVTPGNELFLKISGQQSANISLRANELSGAKRIFELEPGVSDAVISVE
ncbi:right-handed parallel beta-helix repeat-containing protein [candidate division KSB1 bacterium]|nr:right-handed parallel beta-helix repeat-containing protein [candidate division KSB1 bacterium]